MKIKTLLLNSFLNFLAMFVLTYSSIAIWDHFYISLNKIYMAAIMTMPMILINILVLHSKYKNKHKMLLTFTGGLLGLVILYIFIRNQTGIDNVRFLKSMIPHHSTAILACQKSSITDPEIKTLCEDIIKAQREEIEIMKQILKKY